MEIIVRKERTYGRTGKKTLRILEEMTKEETHEPRRKYLGLAIVILHRLVGVREGTIVAALIVGIIIKYFIKILKPVAEVKCMLPKVQF